MLFLSEYRTLLSIINYFLNSEAFLICYMSIIPMILKYGTKMERVPIRISDQPVTARAATGRLILFIFLFLSHKFIQNFWILILSYTENIRKFWWKLIMSTITTQRQNRYWEKFQTDGSPVDRSNWYSGRSGLTYLDRHQYRSSEVQTNSSSGVATKPLETIGCFSKMKVNCTRIILLKNHSRIFFHLL
jgi:hypothetical protein